eukprot:1026212-Rhodomonas_salina.1
MTKAPTKTPRHACKPHTLGQCRTLHSSRIGHTLGQYRTSHSGRVGHTLGQYRTSHSGCVGQYVRSKSTQS